MSSLKRVLIIAGSDSGGGAGLQADIKTISALGAYAATAVTAVTVQNTLGVSAIHAIPPDIISQQIEAVLSDIGADAIKIGMLGNKAAIEAVAESLAAHAKDIPIVLDPVMVAKGGAHLLEDAAMDALKTRLIPLSAVLTPNLPEAERLTGLTIEGPDDMPEAAKALKALGPKAVYLKGGHLPGPHLVDLLLEDGKETLFEESRIDTPHTHGTGCTLASAIAAGLAQGLSLADAAKRAHAFVHAAIATAPGLGQGNGPLNHLLTIQPVSG